MEVKIVVGRKFHLADGEDLYPGLRILNSLDGSWALRLSGFSVRLACSNQLYAQAGNVMEWRELHLSSSTDLLGQLGKAIHDFLGHFQNGLGLYSLSMHQEILADEVEPRSSRKGSRRPTLGSYETGWRPKRPTTRSCNGGPSTRWP